MDQFPNEADAIDRYMALLAQASAELNTFAMNRVDVCTIELVVFGEFTPPLECQVRKGSLVVPWFRIDKADD